MTDDLTDLDERTSHQPIGVKGGCALPRALELIGERWSYLIVLSAFHGISHFEDFQAELGIARNILADRLSKLTAANIFERTPCAHDRRRVEYRLTDMGLALSTPLMALRQWGETWITGEESKPVLVDRENGEPIGRIAMTSSDGRPLTSRDVRWVYDDAEESKG